MVTRVKGGAVLRKAWQGIVIALSVMGFGLYAEAGQQLLFAPPDGAWLMANDNSRPPKFYGATDPSATWHVAQHQNPGPDLSPFEAVSLPGGEIQYKARAPDAAVTLRSINDQFVVTLSQDGKDLPCKRRDSQGGAWEFDLFFGMNGRGTANGKPIPRPRLLSVEGRLADMLALRHTVRMKLLDDRQPRSQTDCQSNMAGFLTALVLENDLATPRQILFYRIDLGKLCFTGPQQGICERNRPVGLFYRRGVEFRGSAGVVTHKSFGYRDSLISYNRQLASPRGAVSVDIDVLPRLKELISSGAHGMDPNWSHWRIVSTYFGQNIWGNAAVSSEWSDYRFLVETP